MPSILIVTNRAPWPLQDGGALAMHQMIRGYKKEGWEAHLLCMNTGRHFVNEKELGKAYGDLKSLTAVPFDNRLRPGRMFRNLFLSSLPEHAERFWSADFEKELLNAVERQKPDVVQFESLFLTGYLPALRRCTKATVILRLHNIEQQVWARAAKAAKGARQFYLRTLARRMKKYEQDIWQQYNLLLPITAADAEAVKQCGCTTPLHLTPFGIKGEAPPAPGNLHLSSNNFPAALHQLYHIGAMDWIPNREAISWFIREAWPLVHKAAPQVHFHFAGRGLAPDFAKPLPEGITNHGAVDDATAFMASKDILVVPLRAGGGIRVKILEAMSAGKLVIATTVGMQGIDAIPDHHFLQADSAEEFAAAIKWASENPQAAHEITKAARALVQEKYDADEIAHQLSVRVEKLIQQEPGF